MVRKKSNMKYKLLKLKGINILVESNKQGKLTGKSLTNDSCIN